MAGTANGLVTHLMADVSRDKFFGVFHYVQIHDYNAVDKNIR